MEDYKKRWTAWRFRGSTGGVKGSKRGRHLYFISQFDAEVFQPVGGQQMRIIVALNSMPEMLSMYAMAWFGKLVAG